MKYFATIQERTFVIEIKNGEVWVDGVVYEVENRPITAILSALRINHQTHDAVILPQDGKNYEVNIMGEIHTVLIQNELTYRMAQAEQQGQHVTGMVTIKSPMPGLILKILVAVGDHVHKGQTVVILESMKMENELKSPRDGVIKSINTIVNATVEKGQPLVTIDDE